MSKLITLRKKTPVIDDVPERLFVSKNDKTGWSINTSIAQTCSPTRACAEYCYGLGGRIVMPAALRRQAENTAFFDKQTPQVITNEAIDIVHVVSRTHNFLRMFGVGDLQLGSVLFINQMATYAIARKPTFSIWVATRKVALAEQLEDEKNLHVMLGFDGTTSPKRMAAGRALLDRGPNWFGAWVKREEAEIVPPWISVVFEEHKAGSGRAKRAPDPKACPATIHESLGSSKALVDACSQCRYCFDVKRRENQKPY